MNLSRSFYRPEYTVYFVHFGRWRHQWNVKQRWSSLPVGGTGGEVYCLRLHLIQMWQFGFTLVILNFLCYS